MAPLLLPAARPSAVVLDSPHSGTEYPADFGHACDRATLRQAEDYAIDRLYAFAPALGAPLLCAPFPRSYIDVNRAVDDIDPLLLSPEERSAADLPSGKSSHGMGLVWRLVEGQVPMYDRPLTRAEIARRVERCWRPYHAALDALLDAAQARHGFALHLNCHSMPSRSPLYPAEHGHRMPYDFLLGSRDGSTAAPSVLQALREPLEAAGFRVGVDRIYKGVELVRRHGRPAQGRHAVQIEVNRALYMDEPTHQLHDGFERVQCAVHAAVQALLVLVP